MLPIMVAQTVSGRLVNQSGVGLSELQVQLFVGAKIYSTISSSDGYFEFINITGIYEDQLPQGFLISGNYPNPFNPITRFKISLPQSTEIKLEVFNVIGERVKVLPEKSLTAGTSYYDLELNGLPNGFYIARFVIDGKMAVVKKIMLLYGSDHLTTSENYSAKSLYKISNTIIDSLVVTNLSGGKKTFTDLPDLIGDFLDLGNLVVDFLADCPATLFYAGRMYNTILIGDQCWLRENLDVGIMVDGAYDLTNNSLLEKYCYANDELNCETYGGLFQWDEAMQFTTVEKSQGICPEYWHIPTYNELQTLRELVDRDGTALKALGQGIGEGAGTNASGFSALLAGSRHFVGGNYDLGMNAYFWSSTEYNSEYTYSLWLLSGSADAYFLNFFKDYGFSVRCLRDKNVAKHINIISPSDNIILYQNSTHLISWADNIYENVRIELWRGNSFETVISASTESDGEFEWDLTPEYPEADNYKLKIFSVDDAVINNESEENFSISASSLVVMNEPCPDLPSIIYAGKTYNTVQIGEQCWLKENLDIGLMVNRYSEMTDNHVLEKYCYEDLEENCETYGALYQWHEALQYVSAEGSQGICPNGWHVPSQADFETLSESVGRDGNALKLTGFLGTNKSGFSALLAGTRITSGFIFDHLNNSTQFLSSSVSTNGINVLRLYGSRGTVGLVQQNRNRGFSVRCLKN